MTDSTSTPTHDARLYRRVTVPREYQVTRGDTTFGGDLRIGDLTGDGRCDFLVYRCTPELGEGRAAEGLKPCFLGAFDLHGAPLWTDGEGGGHPARPAAVTVHDFNGDGAAAVLCLWHRPRRDKRTAWDALEDVVIQRRDGRTGAVVHEAAPAALTARRRKDPQAANWVHQRLQIANFRGLARPRDVLIKLGDTYLALDENFNVLWTHRTPWTRYGACPAYVPAVGDLDGDGHDEVFTGYAVLDAEGEVRWQRPVAPHMDSVLIAEWDAGHRRAIGSGGGHVLDIDGRVILQLGAERVPHGQEVRVANFVADHPGPDMAIRCNGHRPDLRVVSSATGDVVRTLTLNASPNNTGMEPVHWRGRDEPALLFNGGWLWDLDASQGAPLPGLPPPRGRDVHRMSFHHAIAADVCGDAREELVVWDPAATDVHIYTPPPLDDSAYMRYRAGPRQYNARLMD
ncbi:MAG: hypothetical protein ACODAQ_06655 [Phycisphaeraceae bacterium]